MAQVNDKELIQDDMVFTPYMGGVNDWQCKMTIAAGVISVRFGGSGLMTDVERPYEVWYPTEDAPTPCQTADDIWSYVSGRSEQFGCLCPRTKEDNCDRKEPCKECETCPHFRQTNCH